MRVPRGAIISRSELLRFLKAIHWRPLRGWHVFNRPDMGALC